jgi:hypothetical protein
MNCFFHLQIQTTYFNFLQQIVVGDTLTVKCKFTDEYSYIRYDYDYYDTHDNTTCKDDHTMTKIHKECPEGMS